MQQNKRSVVKSLEKTVTLLGISSLPDRWRNLDARGKTLTKGPELDELNELNVVAKQPTLEKVKVQAKITRRFNQDRSAALTDAIENRRPNIVDEVVGSASQDISFTKQPSMAESQRVITAQKGARARAQSSGRFRVSSAGNDQLSEEGLYARSLRHLRRRGEPSRASGGSDDDRDRSNSRSFRMVTRAGTASPNPREIRSQGGQLTPDESFIEFDLYGIREQRREERGLIGFKTDADVLREKQSIIRKEVKQILNNFLTKEKQAKQNKDQQQSQGFFRAKKQKAVAEARIKEMESEESNIKDIIKDIIILQPRLEAALFSRFLRVAQVMQGNFLFRYKILDSTLNKLYRSKQVRMDRLETNFVQMESVYGKRMATFLRWKITKEAKDQHMKWESQTAEYKRRQDLEIEKTELQMFLNSFNFSETFLQSGDLVSLTTLDLGQVPQKNRMGFDNVAMQVWFEYMLNFRELINILVTKCQEIVVIVEPFVGPRFQKAHADLIRGLLEGLVGLLNQRITPPKVTAALKCSNPKVTEIMSRMVPIIVKEINRNLEKSLEMNLLELKVANIHAKYYSLIQNKEKAYVLLFKAFKQMRVSLEKYVRVFTQYVRLFPILKEYLYDKKQLKKEEKAASREASTGRKISVKRGDSAEGPRRQSVFRRIMDRSSQGSKYSISGRNIDPEIQSKLSNLFEEIKEELRLESIDRKRKREKADRPFSTQDDASFQRVPLVHLVYQLINKVGEENEDLSSKERNRIEQAHSLFLWRDVIKHRTKRTVFMQEYVGYFEKILSIDELMEIVQSLGNSSMDSGAYQEAIGFFKTLIMLSEVHTKFQIVLNSISNEKEEKEERLLKILELNNKIIAVYNKVATAYHMLGDQMSSYLYVVSAMFIYSNSLQMVDDSDPQKYAKKNPNSFLTQDTSLQEEATAGLKHKISVFVENFNEHYRATLSTLELVGKVVEANFEKFGKDFFLSVKNCIQNIYKLQNFRKRTFLGFMGDIPDIHMQKWMKSKSIALLKEIHSIYVGILEPLDIDEFVEIWIQIEVQKYIDNNPNKPITPHLKPGKLNRTKVRFFYDFERQDIEWLQQAFTYAIFSSELRYVEVLEFQAIKKNKPGSAFVDLLKNSSRRILSASRQPQKNAQASQFTFVGTNTLAPEGPFEAGVFASSRSVSGQAGQLVRPTVQKSLVGFHIPGLLTHRIKSVETPRDLTQRVMNNMVRAQLVKLCRILHFFRETRFRLKEIAGKAKRGELYLKRNTGGNKIKQRLERSEKHKDPDHLIGIYLRQQKSCETFLVVGSLARHSRFYREAAESVTSSKLHHQLFDYRDPLPLNNTKLFEAASLPNTLYSFDPKYLPAVERPAGSHAKHKDKTYKKKATKISDSEENAYQHSSSLTQKENFSRQNTSHRGAGTVRFADEENSDSKSGLGIKTGKSGSYPLTRPHSARGYLDILNLLNFTQYFYEEQYLRRIKVSDKRRGQQKKFQLGGKETLTDLSHSGPTKTYSQGGRRDETSKGTKTAVLIDDLDTQIVPTIEDSIPELCSANFTLVIPHYGIYEPVDVTFRISLRKIVFKLHFVKLPTTPILSVFELDLPEDLWILKEKFLLGKNPEMIRTYNPVVFDTLLESFFLPAFKIPGILNQVVQLDTRRLDFEQQLMGLAFPIALTRLSSYHIEFVRRASIFQEFAKADLDNLQALLKVITYLARIVRSCFLNSPRGKYAMRKFSLLQMVTHHSQVLSLFNTKHILNYKVTQLNQAFDEALKRQFIYGPEYGQNNPLLDKSISLDSVVTLLENLFFTVEFLKLFSGETHTPLRYGDQKKDFDMFVARDLFRDEYGAFHTYDMSIKVLSNRLQVSTKGIRQLYHDSVKNAPKYAKSSFDEKQLLILVFFLILENSFVFYLRVDSSFRSTWLKVFSKHKGTIQKKLTKSDVQLKKLILEMPVPHLAKPEQAFISLSEFYHLHRSFELGVTKLNRVDQDTNFLLEDIKNSPTSVYSFLMNLTTSPFEQQLYVDFLQKFSRALELESRPMLQKSRCFYHVYSHNKETVLKSVNFYYFRYDILKEYTYTIQRPMRKLLETFAANLSQPNSFPVKFFNTFLKFYSLAFDKYIDSAPSRDDPSSREQHFQKLSSSKPRPIRIDEPSPFEDDDSPQGIMQQEVSDKTKLDKPSQFTLNQSINLLQALSGIVVTQSTKTHNRHQQQLEEAFNENFREVMRTIPRTSKSVGLVAN